MTEAAVIGLIPGFDRGVPIPEGMVFGRVPPSDLDAEGIVLSACMLETDALLAVQEILEPEHFYADANARIFRSCLELQSTGKPVDAVAVAGHLRDIGRLDQIGGTPYLAQLTDMVPYVVNVTAHAHRIRDKHRLRQLIKLCQTTEALAYSGVVNVQEFVSGVEGEIYGLSQNSSNADTSSDMQGIMTGCVDELVRKRSGKIPLGKQTPYRGLNRLLACLKRGTVTTVAGRPGMGKTSFVTEIITRSACDRGDSEGAVFFSLEMPRDQIGNKVISQWSTLDSRGLDTGFLSSVQFQQSLDAANILRHLPVIVDDKPGITVTELRAALRRHERTLKAKGKKLGLVAIDYLQLMGTHDMPGHLNTNDQLERIMKALVIIAKTFDVPVIALSQLNRGVEMRADKRPNLGDLRSSGAIEQDSYNIIFLYREDQYRKPHEAKDNKGELIVAKARGGMCGVVNVEFIPKATKYVDVTEPADEFDEWGKQYEARFP